MKRAKDFSPAWTAKLKDDMRACGADLGVIVTMACPKEFPPAQPFGLHGVFASHPGRRRFAALPWAERSQAFGLKTPAARRQAIAPETRDFLSSSSIFVTITSVVSISPAMLAALVRAFRVTRSGSTIPALNMST